MKQQNMTLRFLILNDKADLDIFLCRMPAEEEETDSSRRGEGVKKNKNRTILEGKDTFEFPLLCRETFLAYKFTDKFSAPLRWRDCT